MSQSVWDAGLPSFKTEVVLGELGELVTLEGIVTNFTCIILWVRVLISYCCNSAVKRTP